MAEDKQKHPKRGRRYSRAEKETILAHAREHDVASAVEKFEVSDPTI